MIEGICHCGNIKVEVGSLPATITQCNCSICNRLGALWAYYSPDKVNVYFDKQPTIGYTWGEGSIEFHHCAICGCTTHYITTKKDKKLKMAINCRMLKGDVIETIPIRLFNGANF